MLDTSEMEKVMAKLESLEDQELAVSLLKEFNDATKRLGQLLMNLDPTLSHNEWKHKCDEAQKSVDEIVQKIVKI